MLPWVVTIIKMIMWLAACDAAVGLQAGRGTLPCEEEAGKKLSHSFIYRFSRSLLAWEDAYSLQAPCCMIP